jgi:hypothetical protein
MNTRAPVKSILNRFSSSEQHDHSADPSEVTRQHGDCHGWKVFGLIGVTLYGLIWWRWSALRRKRARKVRHQRV